MGINIPDNNCVEVAINVSGAPGVQLGQNVFLEEVRLIINHLWRNDLEVTLISPDGNTMVRLIDERGGSGDHYGAPAIGSCSQPFVLTENRCVSDSVKNLSSISESVGAYIPEESLSSFYTTPFNPNATWTLKICDDKPGDQGFLDYAELIFIPIGCTAPTNLSAFNISPTSISIDWDNGGSCSSNAIVEYGPAGFTPGNGTTAGSANSQVIVLPCWERFDLTNLNQLTTYDIYVRQTCGTYNYLYNSCKVTATTDCILPPVTLLENFDNQTLCQPAGNCIDCPTLSGTWKNATSDEVDWIVNGGGTVSGDTGPSSGEGFRGRYIYLESSTPCNGNKEGTLISECIEVNASIGICHLSFFYHMYGFDIDSLALDVTADGLNWINLWDESGNQGDIWNRVYINLSSYHNQIVQFRFRGYTGSNFRGDIALDRIEFYGSQVKASDVYYADMDGDGFGSPNDSIAVCFLTQPMGYVNNNADCDDTNPNINPSVSEIPCNLVDENCSGNADDVVIFTPSFSAPSICQGEMAIITVTPSNAGQIYYYDTPLGGMPIDSGSIFSTPVLVGTTIYYFQEIRNFSGQRCESSIIPATIPVFSQPDIFNASGNQDVCENTRFDLRNLVIQDNNNASDTLLYFTNDSYSNSAQITNPIVTITSDTLFYIQARSNSGCTDELIVSFFKQTAPIVNINAPDTMELCFQSAPQLISASVTEGVGPFDYSWSTGSQEAEAVVFSRSKGFSQVYRVTAISQTNGCTAQDQIVINTLASISAIEVVDIQEPSFCQENGSIQVEPKDGQGPYDYLWHGPVVGSINNLSTSGYTIHNLQMGAYSITVTDNFGCSKALPQQIVNGPELAIERIEDVSCFGDNNGAIDISIGGLINPTFEWKDESGIFATTEDVNNLGGGIYSLVVDADNVSPCPIDSIVIIEPPLLELLTVSTLPPTCAGLNDGKIELVVTGGRQTATGYNFNWDNGLPNASVLEDLSPGLYKVTISDTSACTTTAEIIIPSTPPIEATLSSTNPTCFMRNDGAINAAITGGNSPYSYQWNDVLNQSTPTAVGLSASVYELSILDANGCEKIVKDTLENPTQLIIQLDTVQSPSCNTINNGAIKISSSGGTGAYAYEWNNGSTTANLNDIGEGIYHLIISDQNNCEAVLDSIIVEAPELMNIAFSTQNPLCIGVNNGSITTSINGGVAPYMYHWNTAANTSSISNLSSGGYFLTVSDANGCTAISDTANLQAPQLINMEDYLIIDSIQCKGMDNGVVFFRFSSEAPGASSFDFQWTDSTVITTNSTGFWLSSDYTTLSAGNYGLAIQDNVGCLLETVFEVAEPDFITIDTVLAEAPSCFGDSNGSAIADIRGGTGPYSYSWTFPDNHILRTSEGVLTAIEGGGYELKIIDANGCLSDSYNFEVEAPNPINIDIFKIEHVNCSSPENGSIDIAPSGGRGSFSFEWNNGLQTEDLDNLDAGIYTITLTDGSACTQSQPFKIEFEEDSLQVEALAIKNTNCSGSADGEIEVKVNGGFGSYQYFWNNGVQTTGDENARLINLEAGIYDVSVIDENNEYLCVGHLGNLAVLSASNIVVELDSFKNQLNCFGDNNGAFFISLQGGKAPYQYLWSNGDISQNQENLTAGNYELTVTDANNCQWTSNGLFPEIVAPNNPFTIANAIATDSLCAGDASGRIDVNVIGGTPPYAFTWSNGANTASIESLLPGSYTLTATDDQNCTVQFDTSIAFKIEALQLSLISANLSCADDFSGFIQANVICGVPPYRFNWSNGDTTENIINLNQGIYGLTVTDARGDQATTMAELKSPPPIMVDSIAIDLIDCKGKIDLKVSGGVPNSYSYIWRDASGTIISTDPNVSQLAPGDYMVTIQDANDCSVELGPLLVDDSLVIQEVFTSSTFNGQSNKGALSVDSIKGGTAPYTYIWYNNSDEIIGTSASLTGLPIGNYYVIVSDQNECDFRKEEAISTSILELTEVEQFQLYPNPTNQTTLIDIRFSENVDVDLTLLNPIGSIIFTKQQLNTSFIQQSFDLSTYPSGLFYLKIKVNDYPAFGEKILFIKN